MVINELAITPRLRSIITVLRYIPIPRFPLSSMKSLPYDFGHDQGGVRIRGLLLMLLVSLSTNTQFDISLGFRGSSFIMSTHKPYDSCN
jgi:hypothetical protein